VKRCKMGNLKEILRKYILPDYFCGEITVRVSGGKIEFLTPVKGLDLFTPLQAWREKDGRIIYRLNRRSKLGKSLRALIMEILQDGEEVSLKV